MSVIADLSFDITDAPDITDRVTSDGTPRGNPVNIAGRSVSVTIHKNLGDGLALLTYSTGAGTVTMPGGGTDGAFEFIMPNADVRNVLGAGDFYWHAECVDPGGEAGFSKGRFVINPV